MLALAGKGRRLASARHLDFAAVPQHHFREVGG
jgi:hypothetical protein